MTKNKFPNLPTWAGVWGILLILALLGVHNSGP